MKIVQSFAQYNENAAYLNIKKRKNREYTYLNYYSFLLSYITINKLYGPITKICNQTAYDSMVKYVPYDEVVIQENENDPLFWNKYKIDVMKTIGEDFIHVDSDVFIFKDFFKSFINGESDILVQDVVSFKNNWAKHFVYENKDYFADTKIMTKPYDGQSFSCGTIGLTKEVQEYYFAGVDVFYKDVLKVGPKNILWVNLLLEETILYLIAIENDFKYDTIIPQELVDKYDLLVGGDMIGYTHVWSGNKYKRNIIKQIRRKIIYDFPEYIDYLMKFEHDVFSKMKIYEYFIQNE